jgi:hypothetical protein
VSFHLAAAYSSTRHPRGPEHRPGCSPEQSHGSTSAPGAVTVKMATGRPYDSRPLRHTARPTSCLRTLRPGLNLVAEPTKAQGHHLGGRQRLPVLQVQPDQPGGAEIDNQEFRPGDHGEAALRHSRRLHFGNRRSHIRTIAPTNHISVIPRLGPDPPSGQPGRRATQGGPMTRLSRRRRAPHRSNRRCDLCERFQPEGCRMVHMDDGLWWLCPRCFARTIHQDRS